MTMRLKNKEQRFRIAVGIYLGIIAYLAIYDKTVEFMLGAGLVGGPYGVANLLGFRVMAQALLIVVGVAFTWSIIAFVMGQFKEIKSIQLELRPRAEYREYPTAGPLPHEDTSVDEVACQWNAARDYATKHPEDAGHWLARMQQIIARSSWKLRKHFENLSSTDLEREKNFAEESLAGARAMRNTEAKIRWKAVVGWIDDAIDAVSLKDDQECQAHQEQPTTETETGTGTKGTSVEDQPPK